MTPLTRLLILSFAVVSPLSASAQSFVENFDSRALGAEVVFQEPRFSGSTSALLAATPNTAAVRAESAASAPNAYKVDWAYLAGTDRWLRLTTFNATNLPNPTIDFRGTVSFDYLLLGPGDLLVSLGARETGTTSALGANGGSAGGIEWIGSTTSGTPRGKTLFASSPANAVFQTMTFDLAADPVRAFTGNGILSSPTNKGVLENLGITQAGTFTANNQYTLYIDNLRIVVVPEPAAPLTCAAAAFVLLGFSRLRRRGK